ncbi:MAG: M20/M25/M40 family metallo-hydrolase [Chitinophagales bacterium]|nr:M20/M25/M40 family metallo-hydrolase [Chitinophagales bacterium]
MKKITLFIFSALVILMGVLFYNYFKNAPDKSIQVLPRTDISSINGYKERVAKALTYQTVSYEDTSLIDYNTFLEFHKYLQSTFPIIFENLTLETVNKYSILLKWSGSNPQLKPGILMAHQDVVPVSEDTKDLWRFPPFEGIIKDDTLFGRGSIDNKANLISQLEAINFLLQQNFKPQRDIYFVFGHDEEIGGKQGALAVAQLLKSRNIQADFVLDEGGYVSTGIVPGVTRPVALVGTAEKGFLNLELSVNIDGGHSSMPNKDNAINTLSKALVNLSNTPFPSSISPSVQSFMAHVSPHSSFINRLAMSNLWLFKPLIYNIYSQTAPGDAMIRTTMVPTIIKGGEKDNVIPNIAVANINYRINSGTTIQDVIDHTTKAINNPLVHISMKSQGQEATGVSPVNTESFQHISSSVASNFENSITTPFLMIAGTDSKHFDIVSQNIYKFSPLANPYGFHAVNEYLNLKDYKNTIGFYVDFIKKL